MVAVHRDPGLSAPPRSPRPPRPHTARLLGDRIPGPPRSFLEAQHTLALSCQNDHDSPQRTRYTHVDQSMLPRLALPPPQCTLPPLSGLHMPHDDNHPIGVADVGSPAPRSPCLNRPHTSVALEDHHISVADVGSPIPRSPSLNRPRTSVSFDLPAASRTSFATGSLSPIVSQSRRASLAGIGCSSPRRVSLAGTATSLPQPGRASFSGSQGSAASMEELSVGRAKWEVVRQSLWRVVNPSTAFALTVRRMLFTHRMCQLLRSIPAFASKGHPELVALVCGAQHAMVPRYARIFREMAKAHCFYVLVEGSVEHTSSNGSAQTQREP
eukprot:196578-Prymnesium_polylepis.1